MSDGQPYTRQELEEHPDTFPQRGPLCPRCRTRVPQFAELEDADEDRILEMISQGAKMEAQHELVTATGCSTRFAKIWVLHSGKPDREHLTAPCPYCGGQLATALAQQCKHCFMDWHSPQRPYNLKTKEVAPPLNPTE